MRRGTRLRGAIAMLVLASTATFGVVPGAGASADRPPGPPTALTVDDAAAPLAVEGAPQFGWVVNDADRGEAQIAYEVVVREQPAGGSGRVVWDSGQVRSAQQSYVTAPAGALRLRPDQPYTWTVRTWDRAGRVGPFARPARLDVGLGAGDWGAEWIRRPGAQRAAFEDFSLFRKEVSLPATPIVRGRAYVSAGQQYDLRVNGTRVAHGPSFSYPDEQYYEATDITAKLRSGTRNAIAIVTHWSTPGQGRPASVPALIARVTVDFADGRRQVVTTDGTWRTHPGPWVQGPLRNDEGNYVEHVDGRREPVGWERAGYADRSWPRAEVLGGPGIAPFRHLYAARTHIVEQAVKPVRLTRLANDAYVADYGSVIAATPVVELRHGVEGRAVKVVGGYLLDPDGHVSTTRGVQDTDMHWDYTERAGAQEFRPFGYLGFRYLEVIGAREALAAGDVVAYARHASFPDEHAASFVSSNAALNAVWELLRHSALYASQEQFVDTPTREQGAFQDPNTSSAVMAAFGDRALTFQALRDVARSQRRYWPDGPVNVVYPNGDGKRDIPDSTEQYVDWVWQSYVTTGDRAQLASLYPVVRNISDYVARAISRKTGLVTDLPGGGGDYRFGIVDWPPAMRYGYDMATAARTTENVLAVDVFRLVAAMAGALHRPPAEGASELGRAERLTSAIHARLRRPDGVLVDGLEADGSQSRHASQIANAYALAYGLVPPAQVAAVADHVVALGNSMGVSTFWSLLSALHRAGRDRELVAALTDARRPGYAQILREGATYSWESWNARQVGDSESHAFGSNVLTVMQEDVLGVRVTEPGAARVEVQTPALDPMRVSGVAVTQRGRIPIAWERRSPARFSLDVTIPANVEAEIHVPVADTGAVSDGHAALAGDPGVRAARRGSHEIVLTVGSGHYDLHVPALEIRATRRTPWPAVALAAVSALALLAIAGAVSRRRRRHATA